MLVHKCLKRFIFSILFLISLSSLNSATRTEREGINGQDVGVNIEWLTDDQLSELSETEGRPARLVKLKQFYDALEDSKAKTEATNKIVEQCYDWLSEVVSEEEKSELEQLHEANHEECHKKVHEYLNRLGEEKRGQIEEKLPFCEHVWYGQAHKHENPENNSGKEEEKAEAKEGNKAEEKEEEHHEHHHAKKRWVHRHRRNHDHFAHDDGVHEHHELEDYLRTHLSWLTDEQKAEMRSLKAEGAGKESLRSKAMQYLEQSTGEQRNEAIKQLVSGCRELLRRLFGAEAAEELKQMRESGTTFEELEVKIGKLTEALDDEGKRQKARDYGPACKRIFALSMAVPPTTSRRRRECAQCSERLKHAIKTHLSWLSDEQKAELKADEIAGKTREETKEKVMKWFEAIGEESEKEKARELMKGGCRELIKELLGEEAASKIKQMKEGGATPEALATEIDKLMGEITDEKKKETAALYSSGCKQVFGIKASRKRREHHHGHGRGHTLEDYFKTHLSWLDDTQKENLKTMKGEGKTREEMQKQVMEWFNKLEGEPKTKALELMQTGCRELLKIILGEDKAIEVKNMKEAGTDINLISNKINEWINELSESSHLRKLAEEYKPVCRQLFGVGEEKKPAGRKRRDHHHGHGGGHTLEDYFKTHLSWLDDGQKENLKTMKGEGKTREEMQKKVMEWFNKLEGEPKTKALELMQTGCRELLKIILGEDKAIKVKNMKEAGTDLNLISNKINEWINELSESSHLRKLAEEYKPVCRQLFGVGEASVSRKRRSWKDIYGKKKLNNRGYDDEEEEEDEGYSNPRVSNIEDNDEQTRTDMGDDGEDHDFGDEHLNAHKKWLTSSQKRHIKRMKDKGHEDHEIHDKINEFHETSPEEVKRTAQGILKRGCESVFQRLFGEYIADEIIQAREQGASTAELDEKINTALGHIRNAKKRKEATRFAATCRRIFTMIERRRRSATPIEEQTLEELFSSHLSWLTEAQQEELRRIRDEGLGRTEMQERALEWLVELSGNERANAMEQLREG
uniref:Polyprotein allergen nematode domain-containing protein n=1 Tax=Meloidogyne incognita TaxID=6306 RepID=A0A914KK33_MELIC